MGNSGWEDKCASCEHWYSPKKKLNNLSVTGDYVEIAQQKVENKINEIIDYINSKEDK